MVVLENVSMRLLLSVGDEFTQVGQDAHFCYNLLSISLAHALKVEFLVRKYLQDRYIMGKAAGRKYWGDRAQVIFQRPSHKLRVLAGRYDKSGRGHCHDGPIYMTRT